MDQGRLIWNPRAVKRPSRTFLSVRCGVDPAKPHKPLVSDLGPSGYQLGTSDPGTRATSDFPRLSPSVAIPIPFEAVLYHIISRNCRVHLISGSISPRYFSGSESMGKQRDETVVERTADRNICSYNQVRCLFAKRVELIEAVTKTDLPDTCHGLSSAE